ncbi:phosphate transporter subunit; periplasmic-binding component of ABC superfamily [uncultured spirochete]|uniref:Phosphate-binding protein n=1 Tax=uncultured spirochete TaxID=156406 RepID=A0A3P3XMG3_9SPIR|nr:phosphate transporter subunit; periplasmic-binding component of ABC superfamily [uncultured spirochete]
MEENAMKRNAVSRKLVLLALFVVGLTGVLGAQSLLGSGASFPAPAYTKMFDEYYKATGVKVNYQSIGSSGGLKNIQDRVVDFGGSDSFIKDADFSKYPAQVVHIPTVIGAVVVTYNLPGNPKLRLTGDVVADIYLGKITKWNDKAVAELNPNVKLPNLAIMPVYRSDGSGTTFNFTAYLSAVSAEWKSKVGNANSVSWPAGQGAAQNAGVAGVVKQTQGSVGYVELAYANQNSMAVAAIKNSSGMWVDPSLESISAAAAGAFPADTRILLVNTDAKEGYPISALTWIIVYREQNYGNRSREQADQLAKLLWWMIHDGQKYVTSLDYATLPAPALKAAEAIIKSITYDGQPLVK